MMATELKPCPFCGGYAAIGNFRGKPMVYCGICGIQGAHARTQEKAIEAWNTRFNASLSLTGKP